MDTLPVEILDLIVSQCDASSLCSLRLTCRALDTVAAQRLWASITVKPDRQVMGCFSGVLRSPKLSKYVRKVSFNTGIEHRSLNSEDYCRDAPEYVNLFTNLESLLVHFSNSVRSAHPDMSPAISRIWLGHKLSGLNFQSAFLSFP
jgi:hypothetical protein